MRQLGTSGTGNHFVEWGTFRLYEPLSELQPGEYLALLSHSGSRSIGYKIADRYSRVAMENIPASIRGFVSWHGFRSILKRDRSTGSQWNSPENLHLPIITLSITAWQRLLD